MNQRIENYFTKNLSEPERTRFEAELKTDPELASDVSFYLASLTAAQDARSTTLEKRHAEWQALRKPDAKFGVLRTWYAVAAALAFIGFGIAWYALTPEKADLTEMANAYTLENFTTLSVQMGGNGDSIQLAIDKYNKGQYATSTKICDEILKRDPSNAEAKKIAGIVSLKLLDYDKAVTYFHLLGEQPDLYANPGKFYEAIALIKSGIPLNKKKAKKLLQEVIDGNLEGKPEAMKWMK